MNKSLLLIVCDFLLLSLLGFVQFDIPENETLIDENTQLAEENPRTAEDDLIDALRLSLDEQKKIQEDLTSNLSVNEVEIISKEEELKKKEEALRKLASDQQKLLSEKVEIQKQLLATEEEKLEKEKSLEQVEESLKNAESRLDLAVQTADELLKSNQTLQSKVEKVEIQNREIEKNADQLINELDKAKMAKEMIQSQLTEIKESKEFSLVKQNQLQEELEIQNREKQRLAYQLRALQNEKLKLEQDLSLTQKQVELEREERQILRQQTDELTKGVSELVTNTVVIKDEVSVLQSATIDIRDEVRELQTLTDNEIFQNYASNKIQIQLTFSISGIFGIKEEVVTIETIMLTKDELYFLLFNTKDTPLEPDEYMDNIVGIQGSIIAGKFSSAISRIGFLSNDNRIAVIPLQKSLVDSSNLESFSVTDKPFGHSSVALINSENQKFGSTTFKVVPEFPNFLKIDSRVLSKLFGEFSPSTNDIVFTLKGEFLGIMPNNKYALKVDDLNINHAINLLPTFNREDFVKTHKNRVAITLNLPEKLK